MEEMGEGKIYFPLLKSVKRHKSPLGQSVSITFVTDSNIWLKFHFWHACTVHKKVSLHSTALDNSIIPKFGIAFGGYPA